jgi:hypothetical protein
MPKRRAQDAPGGGGGKRAAPADAAAPPAAEGGAAAPAPRAAPTARQLLARTVRATNARISRLGARAAKWFSEARVIGLPPAAIGAAILMKVGRYVDKHLLQPGTIPELAAAECVVLIELFTKEAVRKTSALWSEARGDERWIAAAARVFARAPPLEDDARAVILAAAAHFEATELQFNRVLAVVNARRAGATTEAASALASDSD